jgi:simple sugar transport system permease protein
LTALLLQGVLGQEGVFSSDRIPTFPTIEIPFVKDLPVIGPLISGHTILVYLSYLSVPVVAWFLYRTPWGLRVRVVGEAEAAAAAAGVKVDRVKFQTMALSGAFCGLAGAYLSLGYVSLFSKQMTNERGLIALAAIFFAKGNPYWTAAVALLFGAAQALSVRLPQVTGAAPQLLQLIPYVVTVLALIVVGIRTTRLRSRHGAWRFEI